MCKNLTINDVDGPACVCECVSCMHRIKCTNSFGANHIVHESIANAIAKHMQNEKQISYEYELSKGQGGRRIRQQNPSTFTMHSDAVVCVIFKRRMIDSLTRFATTLIRIQFTCELFFSSQPFVLNSKPFI